MSKTNEFRAMLDKARDYHDQRAAEWDAYADDAQRADVETRKARIYEAAAQQLDALSVSESKR